MSFNLVDLIKNELGDVVLDQVTSLLGESKENTTNAVSAAIPGVLENIVTSSSKPGGANVLASTLGDMDDGLLGKFASMLGGGNHASLIGTGGKLLGSILGGSGVSKIATIISRFSGIKSQSATSIIGLLAPVILGVIRKKMSSDNLDAQGLMSMLQGQKDNIAQAVPVGMQNLVESETIERSVQRPMVETSEGSGLGKWLWLPLLLLAGFLAYKFLPPLLQEGELGAINSPVSGIEETTDNIKQSVESSIEEVATETSGYAKIGSDFGSVINGVSDTFTNVTDVESAKAALPQLKEATSKLGALSELFNKLPESGKSAISGTASNQVSNLQPIIDKVTAIPGVGAVLKPATDSLMQALSAFTAS